MSDILAELDEQMRAERLEKIWHDHKHWIIGTIAAILIATLAVSMYQKWDKAQNVKGTAALYAIMDDATFPNNVDANTDLSAMRGGVQAVLLLNAAHGYVAQEQEAEAMALYGRLIDEADAPESLKSLAHLMRAKLEALQETPDTDAIMADLNAIDDNSAFFAQGAMEKAIVYAQKDDFDAALEALETIKNTPLLPDTLYLKAQSLTHVYSLKKGASAK